MGGMFLCVKEIRYDLNVFLKLNIDISSGYKSSV